MKKTDSDNLIRSEVLLALATIIRHDANEAEYVEEIADHSGVPIDRVKRLMAQIASQLVTKALAAQSRISPGYKPESRPHTPWRSNG